MRLPRHQVGYLCLVSIRDSVWCQFWLLKGRLRVVRLWINTKESGRARARSWNSPTGFRHSTEYWALNVLQSMYEPIYTDQKFFSFWKPTSPWIFFTPKNMWSRDFPLTRVMRDEARYTLRLAFMHITVDQSLLTITRTLANLNLTLTRSNFRFLSGHFLYSFTLDNSNFR